MKRLAALSLALLLCLALFGCAGDAPVEDRAPIQPLPTPAPQPTASSAVNPVSIFYAEYHSACRPLLRMFERRLGADASISSSDTLIYLADHNLNLSQGSVTFGWLLSTDTADTFSSTVAGAADGSGTIAPMAPGYDESLLAIAPTPTPAAEDGEEGEEEAGEERDAPSGGSPAEGPLPTLPIIPIITPTPSNTPDASASPSPAPDEGDTAYALRFSYASGEYLYGTLEGSNLSYRSAQGGVQAQLLLEDGVWISTVSRQGGIVTDLTCDENGMRFYVKRLGADGSESVVHAWVCDRSGAKYIEGQGLA